MDERTHNTLDDLADLFLTGTGDALSGPAPIKLPPKAAVPPPVAPPIESAHHGDDLEDQVRDLLDDAFESELGVSASDYGHIHDKPTLRLAQEDEKPAVASPRDAAELPEEESFDTSDADLEAFVDFAPEDEASFDQPLSTPTTATGVAEAVVLGNLPGMSGPWLTQYGQLLAQQDGHVAILHLRDDHLDLELIEPTDHRATTAQSNGERRPTPAFRIPPGGFGQRDLIDVLELLAGSPTSPVRTFLVHLDASPGALSYLLDFEYWTLLSGADDAAIVAGYRLLKQLLESDERVARAHVGLMVVGSDRTAGQSAARKLRAAVANFLHAPLELIGYQQKMVPARCRTLGSFGNLPELWPRLTAWLNALQPPAAQPAAAHEEATANKLPPLQQPVQVAAQPAATAEPRRAEPQPAETAGRDFDAQAQEIDLFALIDSDHRTTASIPGGIALEARCPSQPDTQLALDAAGRLHLLHRHDSADGDPPTPKEAIVELVAVRDWARQHRQLLQLTERGRRFDPDTDPILHLFTDRADLSVNLVARLGGLLKLHLLRDVAIGDTHTLFCTPLSA